MKASDVANRAADPDTGPIDAPTWRGKTVRQRFEVKIRITPGCWLWTGEKGGKGYGRMTIAKKYLMAHRLSYELYVGPIPSGMIICHTCDNPACVNPDHLWPGTDKTNAEDKMAKGRWACGKRVPGQELSYARLSDEDVYAIRADGRYLKLISEEYGISAAHVNQIKTRIRWQHLPPRGDERDSPDGRKRPRGTSIKQSAGLRPNPRPSAR